MATNGPKITQDQVVKFQAILRLPAGAEKTKLQQALSPEERVLFSKYVEIIKHKKAAKQATEQAAAAQADKQSLLVQREALVKKEQESDTSVKAAQARKAALEAKLADTQSKLKELELRDTELRAQDKAIVVQGSRGFARELDGVKKQPAPAANKQVTIAATGLKY